MNIQRNHLWISVPVLLLAAGSVLAGPRHITKCDTVISRPGYYQVRNDLNCAPETQGVVIESSNVTLDLKGHTIACDASGEGLVGAVLIGWDVDWQVRNVRVSNGTVTGCDDGILLGATRNVKVQKMSFNGNVESAVTLVAAEKSKIMNNQFEGDFWAVRSYGGSRNSIVHNTVRYTVIGIDLYAERNSNISCNTLGQNFYSLSMGPIGNYASSGNIVHGNLVTDNYTGILSVGIGTPGGVTNPQSYDNLVNGNIALGNYLTDLGEVLYDDSTEDLFPEPGASCQNFWRSNSYETSMGPDDCFSSPVNIDLEDVCAMEDDD